MGYVAMPLREQVRRSRALLALTAYLLIVCWVLVMVRSPEWQARVRLNDARWNTGLPRLAPPPAYWTWTADRQLVWVINNERAIRDLPPATMLTRTPYERSVVEGISSDGDPNPNVYAPGVQQAESIWAWTNTNPASLALTGAAILNIDYGWVYNDGWNGSLAATTNIDCVSPHAPGCWGHRDAVLGSVPGTTLVIIPGVSLRYLPGSGIGTAAAAILVWTTDPSALR